MKVVFITPDSDSLKMGVFRLGDRFFGYLAPMAGAMLWEYTLKKSGHDVDSYGESPADIDLTKLRNVDVFCIYTVASNLQRAYSLADKFRKETDARVLIGGGVQSMSLLKDAPKHADQVIVGESTRVIKDVVDGRITDKIVNAQEIDNIYETSFEDKSIPIRPINKNKTNPKGCPYGCTCFDNSSDLFWTTFQLVAACVTACLILCLSPFI